MRAIFRERQNLITSILARAPKIAQEVHVEKRIDFLYHRKYTQKVDGFKHGHSEEVLKNFQSSKNCIKRTGFANKHQFYLQ